MITRRALRRTALFRPDADVQRIFIYTLAVVAERHRIDVHAAVLMSAHEHRRGTRAAPGLLRGARLAAGFDAFTVPLGDVLPVDRVSEPA